MSDGAVSPRPPGDRSSLLWLAGVCGLLLFGAVCGFLLLPASEDGSFDAWAAICRAAGLGGPRGSDGPVVQGTPASNVAWTAGAVQRATAGKPEQGRNSALSCTGCHGAGIVAERTLIPPLAGMDPLSFTKQMADYASGHRASVLMQAFAATLSPSEVADLAGTLGRLAVVPGLAFLLLPLAGLTGKPMSESVVALAMPSAVMLIILSVRYRVAEKESASVLLYTYVLSALSMAAAVLLTK